MYKILTQIHLNYKFKKITFKNFQIHGLSDYLAKGVNFSPSNGFWERWSWYQSQRSLPKLTQLTAQQCNLNNI